MAIALHESPASLFGIDRRDSSGPRGFDCCSRPWWRRVEKRSFTHFAGSVPVHVLHRGSQMLAVLGLPCGIRHLDKV